MTLRSRNSPFKSRCWMRLLAPTAAPRAEDRSLIACWSNPCSSATVLTVVAGPRGPNPDAACPPRAPNARLESLVTNGY